ncbi:hypothetical protein ACS0TY_005511 [Phlomoides rotata]
MYYNPMSSPYPVCKTNNSLSCGELIHGLALKHGVLGSYYADNALMDMCIGLNEADRCFCGMLETNIITWNTMVAGYEKSDPYEALNLYSRMESKGVANALIDVYAKCGSIMSSFKIFSGMSSKSVISWTSMIIGYGPHRHGKEALELFDEMVRSGVRPDQIVFVVVLNACSYTGLVDEGLRYFKSMVSDYNITPDQEIYGCIVDLLGRAGRVKEEYELIDSMSFIPDESIWGAFFGSCKALGELGKLATNRVLELRPSVAGTYLTLANIYAADGKWGDVAWIRKLLRKIGK